MGDVDSTSNYLERNYGDANILTIVKVNWLTLERMDPDRALATVFRNNPDGRSKAQWIDGLQVDLIVRTLGKNWQTEWNRILRQVQSKKWT